MLHQLRRSERGTQIEVREVREGEDERGENVGRKEGGSEAQPPQVGEEGAPQFASIIPGVRVKGAGGRKVGGGAVVRVFVVLVDGVDSREGRREEGRRAETVEGNNLLEGGTV